MRLPGVFRMSCAGRAGHGRFGFAPRQRVRRSGREPHDSRAAQPHHKGQNPCQYARKRYAVTGGRREDHPALSGLGRKVASTSCRRPRWTHVHPHQFRALRHHIWSLLHDEGERARSLELADISTAEEVQHVETIASSSCSASASRVVQTKRCSRKYFDCPIQIGDQPRLR